MDAVREARFWAKVAKSDGCWEWTGAIGSRGYGNFWSSRERTDIAHRLAYQLIVGPVPVGMDLDHLCRNRKCVRPDHLEPVTRRENVMRSPIAPGAINARATHCQNGHPWDDVNTYRTAGRRQCRTCNYVAVRAYRQRRKEAVSA